MINKSILSYDDNKQGNFSLNLLSHDLRTEPKTNLKRTIILDSFKSMNTAFRPGIRSARFVLAAHWYYEAVLLSLSVHSCDHFPPDDIRSDDETMPRRVLTTFHGV